MLDLQRQPAWRLAAALRMAADASALPSPARLAPQQRNYADGAPTLLGVRLPSTATAPAHLDDPVTHVAIDVALLDARDIARQTVDGYAVYPKAHRSGATIVERELPEGVEDYLGFEARPAVPAVDYQLALGEGAAGLRLVANTLEVLDDVGTPRLRAEPPYIIGADGERTDATLAVEGCEVDTDPAAPWGRAITPPGSRTCRVHVSWDDAAVSYPAILDPRWVATQNMTSIRRDFTATLMSTGKVLAVGGRTSASSTTGLLSAELFDPASNSWSATSSLPAGAARYLHTATQLGTTSSPTTSGKVLVAGGTNGGASLSTAWLYSPSAGTWIAATNLNSARHSHTATLLANGNVLFAAGLSGTTVLNTAAVYNPSSGAGTVTATGNMPQAVKLHTATLIQVPANGTLNNKVVVVGGNSGTASVANVQLFDGSSSWSSLTALSSSREGHTATALANGNVLVTGGRSGNTTLNTTFLFNVASGSGSWSSAGTMTAARQLHTATLLPSALVKNGAVLLAGGSSGTASLNSAELWNGTTTWTATTTLPAAVQGQTATLLNNNLVLLAGGANGSTTVSTSMVYDASFALSCTSNSQCASGFCVSGVCCDTACNGGCGVCNLPGKVGTCSAAATGTVCRAQAGACDAAETCSGSSLSCPADAVAPLGTVCRGLAGPCDAAETCDGSTKACPADKFAAATTVCRASVGTCDATETCTGTSATCPTDKFASATTVCRPATGPCDVAETCTGSSNACPTDRLATAGAVCRAAVSLCDVSETCSGASVACPADTFAPAGTTCGAASGGGVASTCSGTTNSCAESSTASNALGFEVPSDWAVTQGSASALVTTPNTTHTQGQGSLEVAAQGFFKITSVPMTSIGSIGNVALLDIMLPTNQANPPPSGWFGGAQMLVNCPSQNITNQFLGEVELSGLPLATWQTLAFQIPAATVAALSTHTYSDLSFSVVLNVPSNETGHYLLDNIRFTSDVVPSLVGLAQEGSVTKAIFDYTTSAPTDVNILYGPSNGLLDQNGGFIQAPTESPPTRFVSGSHEPFVATMAGTQLSWTVLAHTVTATRQSPLLSVITLPNGTHDVTIPSGRTVNLDSTPPSPPPSSPEPVVGAVDRGILSGSLSVSPSGAALYTVPIRIPPGVAGIAPDLNLVYNSQGGDGPMGQGWSLTGLSMITRCPNTLAQDGSARAINIDNDSAPVCLDGKRLFYRPDTNTYQLEVNDFSTITKNPVSEEFDVVLKNGEIRHYGSSENSRVALPAAHPNSNNPLTNVVWLLDKVEDGWGNYYLVNYNEDDLNQGKDFTASVTLSGIRVTSFKYTGHPAGVSPSGVAHAAVSPTNTISFNWLGNRKDTRSLRFGAWTIPMNSQLTAIVTPQGQYVLTYAINTDPSLPTELNNLQFCPNGQACLPALSFGWNQPNYSWQPSTSYQLPATVALMQDEKTTGTFFLDLNSDGLPDLVQSKGSTNRAWQNTGSGWTPAPQSWVLPSALLDGNGTQVGLLVDIDGDGVLDLITPGGRELCDVGGDGTCTQGALIWYNRINTPVGGWQQETGPLAELATYPNTFGVLNFHGVHVMADMDGDGRADMVCFPPGKNKMQVALNTPNGWVDDSATRGFDFTNQTLVTFKNPYRIIDINRDGIGDVATATQVWLNDGCNGPNGCQFTTFSELAFPNDPPSRLQFGDIDGDGYTDVLEDFAVDEAAGEVGNYGCPLGNANLCQEIKLAFNVGNGYAPPGDPMTQGPPGDLRPDTASTFSALVYQNSLDVYTPGFPAGELNADGVSALGDINGDGLVDVILRHNKDLTGSVLFNTGSTFKDGNNATGFTSAGGLNALPMFPDNTFGIVLQDVNGDGLPDLVQAFEGSGVFTTNTWLNTYQRPVITTFPNQRARPTAVAYEVITTGAAHADGTYFDSPNRIIGTTYLTAPLSVVKTVTTDDGLAPNGPTDVTTYQYESLRGSGFGRGPQGFNAVTVSDAATGFVTRTTYSQVYPYTGLPVQVGKSYTLVDVTTGAVHLVGYEKTVNTYCAYPIGAPNLIGTGPPCASPLGVNYPPGTSLFNYPAEIDVFTTLVSGTTADLSTRNSPPVTTTTTTLSYDDAGNPLNTTVQTSTTGGETWHKVTVNDYGAANSPTKKQGKVVSTTVTSQQIALGFGTKVVHTTSYGYAPTGFSSNLEPTAPLALTLKQVEPGSGIGNELDTAYAYDMFGNVIQTTECANQFDSCGAPGATGDPTLPYRVSQVSYDPADFVGPAGTGLVTSLQGAYNAGQFEVKRTNAAGHTEYTVFDPVLGLPTQKTGPNGVTTCYAYDVMGRQTSSTDRCGSTQPRITTINRYGAGTGATPAAVLVTVTRAPDGGASWNYTDPFGREVETLDRNANGGLTETLTTYMGFGPVATKTRPFLQGDTPFLTSYTYDGMNRPINVFEAMGDITGTGAAAVMSTDIQYVGAQTITKRTVNGVVQQRTEFKNAIGKLAAVKDSHGTVSQFIYDGDGRLTDFDDSAGHNVNTTYDIRGRKQGSIDPDTGTWIYTYDGFGDLTSQLDANGVTTVMTYDLLGRMVGKSNSLGESWQWMYDKAPGAGIGKLAATVGPADTRLTGACTSVPFVTLTDGNRPGRSFTYDVFGNVLDDSECIDGKTFVTSHVYDSLGREASVLYPAINGVRTNVGYHYNQFGLLQYLTDDGVDGSVLWQLKTTNALGQVTDEQAGNGVEAVATRNPTRGWLLKSTSTAHHAGDAIVQDWAYSYDEAGNLLTRSRDDAAGGPASSEKFVYDVLNRLTSAETIVTADNYDKVEPYVYDDLGNLTQKGDAAYVYQFGCAAGPRPAGPHMACVAGTALFNYDGNGNVDSGGGRFYLYNGSNRAIQIHSDSSTGLPPASVDFVYDSDNNRVVQSATSNGLTNRTLYVGLGATGKSLYEQTTGSDGSIQHVQFFYAGGYHNGNAFAVRSVPADSSAPTTSFYSFDHLGSVTAMTDATGQVVGASSGPSSTLMNYDAWGARRNPDGEAAAAGSFNLQVGHREYTGHETVPGLALVNMNGRIYDPALARFLTADPNVQFPTDMQSYNRYTYANNNPLSFTDPTGFFSLGSIGAMGWMNIGLSVTGIVGCAVSGGSLCPVAFGLMSALLNFSAAVANGQSVGQTLAISAIGIFAGAYGGALGGSISDGILGAMVGGALSSAVSGTLVGLATGHLSGTNILEAAAQGAAWGAVAWGAKELTPVDQAAQAPPQSEDPSDDADGLTRKERRMVRFSLRAKAAAIAAGDVSKLQIGDLPVVIYGGDDLDRLQVGEAMQDILDGDSARGRTLRVILEAKVDASGNVIPAEVVITNHMRAGTFTYDGLITFDKTDLTTHYDALSGPKTGVFTTTRIMAHEIGHLAGYHDESFLGFGKGMDNVGLNENPIMRELGFPNDRTSYK